MPTLEKRGDSWQAKVRIAGHKVQTATFTSKLKANAWAHALEAELRAQKRGIHRATLGEAITKYITDVCPTHRSGGNEAKRLRALVAVPGLLPVLRPLPDLAAVDLSRFRDTRLEQVAVATVRKEMGILRSVLESARRDWGMLLVNPMGDVKRPPAPPARKRLMSDDELTRILDALGWQGKVENLSHQVAVALQLAIETGLRAGEMAVGVDEITRKPTGLEWSRVYLAQQFLTLPKTKNGDARDVPLSRRAVELIGLMRGVDPARVFTITSASLDALFRKARDKCKITGLHFHDSRATAVTRLAARLDILDLARMIGHRDLKSLQCYYRKSASTMALALG